MDSCSKQKTRRAQDTGNSEKGDDDRDSLLPTIENLPGETIAVIAKHCPDLTSLQHIAASSPALRASIFHQNLLQCDHCKTAFFKDYLLNIPTAHTRPFSCTVCHAKLCGYLLFDYGRKGCKPQKCDGCGAIECLKCTESHTSEEFSDGYGTENYCEACQAEFEFGMGGC